jgi:hypothetical protein
MPDARFELIQMAFFPMPKLPEFLKILEVPDKHICDMLILNGWLSVTDTFPQSPSSAYTVDRVEIFSEKPNMSRLFLRDFFLKANKK